MSVRAGAWKAGACAGAARRRALPRLRARDRHAYGGGALSGCAASGRAGSARTVGGGKSPAARRTAPGRVRGTGAGRLPDRRGEGLAADRHRRSRARAGTGREPASAAIRAADCFRGLLCAAGRGAAVVLRGGRSTLWTLPARLAGDPADPRARHGPACGRAGSAAGAERSAARGAACAGTVSDSLGPCAGGRDAAGRDGGVWHRHGHGVSCRLRFYTRWSIC